MKKVPTSADILQRAIWKLIIFITLGFEIVIIGASGHQLYERVVINSQRITKKNWSRLRLIPNTTSGIGE